MKLFHLADLHIGKTVSGFSMLEDQEYILHQILAHARTEKPDAVLIAGDIYDKPSPGGDAVRVFDAFLTELSGVVPELFAISGNHDSPERIGFLERVLSERGLHLHGVYGGQVKTVTLADEFGDVDICLLPFVRPSSVRHFFPDEEIASYDDAVRVAIGGACPRPGVRSVLVMHQFVAGAGDSPERSESEVLSVGGVDRISPSIVSRFDYVALGHLHGAQTAGGEHIRYAGSPLKYSFSEVHHKKAVTVVELREKGDVRVSALPLAPLRDMRKLRGPIAALLSDAVASDGNQEDYLHVTLTDEEEILDAVGRLRTVYRNVMGIAFDNARSRADAAFMEIAPADMRTPAELFAEFFEAQNGAPPDEEQMEYVKDALSVEGSAGE